MNQSATRVEAFIQLLGTLALKLTIAFVVLGRAMSQDPAAQHTVVPLHEFQQGQWVEKFWGDFSKAGPFVLRIHQDSGYIVFPHVQNTGLDIIF
jgi:hypothetical protein